MMARASQEFYLVEGGDVLGDVVLSVKWKSVCWGDGPVFWDLRMVFHALFDGQRANISVKQIIAQNRQGLAELFQEVGSAIDDHILPSLRSLKARSDDRLSLHYSCDAWLASTFGLILILSYFGVFRRRAEDRSCAVSCLNILLAQAADVPLLTVQKFNDIVAANQAVCRLDDESQECRCLHFARVTDGIRSAFGEHKPVRSQVVDLLLAMVAQGDCPRLREALFDFADHFAKAINETAHKQSQQMCNTLSTKLISWSKMWGGIDEHAKEYLTVTAVKRRKIHSPSQALQVLTEDDSSGRNWEMKHCAESIVQFQKSLVGTGVVWVMEDGARAGKPGEDSNFYLMWDAASGFACIPPHQVHVIYVRGSLTG